MAGRDEMDDGRLDDALGRALRRSEDEARPREEFARGLRERFVDGALEPAAPTEAPPLRPLPVPRWIAYPAAAALLGLSFALSGALGPRAEPEPTRPMPPATSPLDVALVAAERRVGASPHLAGRTWKSAVVDGRPWLLPAEVAFVDDAEMKSLTRYMARADSVLGEALPALARRAATPVVAVVAPSRQAFEAIVVPRLTPLPLDEFCIAFSLDDLNVLLVSPGALAPGGPPCEGMDIVHEGVHAWLRARRAPGVVLPLWVDEGLAGAIAQGFQGTKRGCRDLLAQLAEHGMDPYAPEQVLGYVDYGSVAKQAATKAPCEDMPYYLVQAFHSHGQALAMFALDEPPGGARRAAFEAWLGRALDGRAAGDAASVAKALGFESVEALFAARDEWLRR